MNSTVKIREVASTLVRADRSTVFRALPRPEPGAATTLVPDERLALADDPRRGTDSWYVLRDAPGGFTRLVHGTSLTPRSLGEGLFSRVLREELRKSVEADLATVKGLAESAARRAR